MLNNIIIYTPFTNVFLMFIAFSGFLVAFFIFQEKKMKRPLVCPLKANCELVIHSDYSHFFGIPVEILGMIYYSSVALLHAGLILYPFSFPEQVVSFMAAVTVFSFLFSLYLVFIQVFVIKQWCSWCMSSAVFSIIIFIVTLANPEFYIKMWGI